MERDLAYSILATLKCTARYAPIPYLQEAASLALGILQIINDVKSVQEGLVRLANDSCELVYRAVCVYSHGGGNSPMLRENLGKLIRTLTSIHSYAKREMKRSLMVRLIKYKFDQGRIVEYRETLRQSLDVFVLQSLVNIQIGIKDILQKQDEILGRLPKATYASKFPALAPQCG
ncbi:hypothetical protein BDZ94DRAFT_1325216 [Collybia nuda]|uniref:Uncharacterized protein n=1 Tax=Collybia nuda TaxID=64659 RepID=A0A9P5XWF0_9AGAR|nr:hypothetical protein BDZ94DRAFT_1325216 [Collybia nuda]